MNSKFLLAGLFGAITSNLLIWLIYGTLVAGMMAEASMPGAQKTMADFKWLSLILSNLA